MRRVRLQNWRFVIFVAVFLTGGNGSVWIAPRSLSAAVFSKPKPAVAPVASVMAIAKVFEQQGQTQKAIQLYRSILANNPEFVDARQKLETLAPEELPQAQAQIASPESETPKLKSSSPELPIPQIAPLRRNLVLTRQEVSPVVESLPTQVSSIPTERTTLADRGNVWVRTAHATPVEPICLVEQQVTVPKSNWTPAGTDALRDEFGESRYSVIVVQRDNGERTLDRGQSVTKSAAHVRLRKKTGRSREVQDVVDLLDGSDPVARVGAIFRLGELGADARAAIPALQNALFDESEVIRIHAILALWKIDRRVPSAIDDLADVFKGNDEELKELARHVLKEIGNVIPPGAAVISLSDNRDAGSQVVAAKALCKVQKDNALSRLIFIHSLRVGDRNTRLLAAYAIGTLAPQDKVSIQALIQALDDEDNAVRVAATYALGCIGPAAAKAAPRVLQFVVSDAYDSDLRDSAFHAIHALDPELAKTIDLGVGGSGEAAK